MVNGGALEGTPFPSRLGEEGVPGGRRGLCEGSGALTVPGVRAELKRGLYSIGKGRDHRRARSESAGQAPSSSRAYEGAGGARRGAGLLGSSLPKEAGWAQWRGAQRGGGTFFPTPSQAP